MQCFSRARWVEREKGCWGGWEEEGGKTEDNTTERWEREGEENEQREEKRERRGPPNNIGEERGVRMV